MISIKSLQQPVVAMLAHSYHKAYNPYGDDEDGKDIKSIREG